MAFFQVTSSQLRSKAGKIMDLNSQFKAKATQLGEQEASLGSMWEGMAKDAFHQAFLRDRQQMEVFCRLIEQYVQALLEIVARYEQAETRNREIASARNY
ncbi:WXG100 family type VII secretion target [Parablautia muri]|uniref:ESAT-6-like protein n=1 Tax=Parablautia muri TaxID=2320879 RepID=A0A9X5BGJ2_9FIRM|nr:WXG100 family type VII secretion target [Parablautia muri]NBJ93585.1 WXG100 family type VII secretion target [Parablautia muri]